jgi:addiction module HigA family antidote
MVATLWQPSGCCQRFPPRRSLALAGQILLEEFLTPLGVSQYQLVKAVDILARRINEIVHGQRRITAGTALRLSRYLGTSER